MRVRISLGMDIEDVPKESEAIGYKATRELDQALDALRKAIANIEECSDDYMLVINMLEKVRLKLTNTDLIITDLQAILGGLQNYHNGENNVSERRPTVDPSGDTIAKTKDSG